MLSELNQQQKEAVKAVDGRVRVIAGAGTGKTRTLTHRYAYLVNVCGISPKAILSVTFTNKAANEMRERILKLTEKDAPYVCTFHGLCVKILREDIFNLNYPSDFQILDSDAQMLFLKEVFRSLKVQENNYTYQKEINKIRKNKLHYKDAYIDRMTDRCGYKSKKSNIMSEYLKLEYKNFALDYEDILNFTLYLLEKFPNVLRKWQDRFEYIQVDEFQDISARGTKLIEMLSEKHNNLFIVGDPDQTIYSWRGARIDFINKFFNRVNITLSENYRSSLPIINYSNSLIMNNSDRIKKTLLPASKNQVDNNKKPIHHHLKNNDEECKKVVERIEELHKVGYKYNEMVVLYRTRHLLPKIETELNNNKTPYQIVDGVKFFENPQILCVMAYLEFIIRHNDTSIIRIIESGTSSLNTNHLNFLRNKAMNSTYFETLNNYINNETLVDGKPKEFIEFFERLGELNKSNVGVLQILIEICNYIGIKINNNNEEKPIIKLFDIISSMEKVRNKSLTLNEFLDEIAIDKSVGDISNEDKVNLMTIYTAKGLEFKVVFIVDLIEGSFPITSCNTREKMNEERRVAYVAVTRAKEILETFDAEGNNDRGMQQETSRFIANVNPKFYECDGKIKISNHSAFIRENKLDYDSKIINKIYKFGDIIDIDNEEKIIIDYDISTDDVIFNDNTQMNRVELESKDICNFVQPCESAKYKTDDIVFHDVFGKGKIQYVDSVNKIYRIKFISHSIENNIQFGTHLEKTNDNVNENGNITFNNGEKVYHIVMGFGEIVSSKDKYVVVEFLSKFKLEISKASKAIKLVNNETYQIAWNKAYKKCDECGATIDKDLKICCNCGKPQE